jgi:hypothetical protein
MLGEFDAAAEEFTKLTGHDYRRTFDPAINLARCFMAAGKIHEYQQVCASLASAFSEDEIQSNRSFVIDRCVASPYSAVDPQLLLRMTHDPRSDGDHLRMWAENYYIGVCLLRKGEYEEAAKRLSESIDLPASGQDEAGNGEMATMKYFLAIARCRLGHKAQARRLLTEANVHASQAGDLQWNWQLRVDLDELRMEVEKALGQ